MSLSKKISCMEKESTSIEEAEATCQSSQKNSNTPILIWEGTDEDTQCEKFKRFVQKKYKLNFESDKEFHKWSIESFENYWETVWQYFDIVISKDYEKVFVKTGPEFVDCDWFYGATFNYAENLMRVRDDTIAIMSEDELGNKNSITFANLYKEVELYAAAFRKHGLNKGDIVGCYMSNRIEAIIAMLASLSIGAIWGTVIPLLGAQQAAKVVNKMEPKFLITSDRYQFNGTEVDVLNNLPTIADSNPGLEKIIIVVTKDETLSKSISHIRDSYLLPEFLESGKLADGTVPELVFEQLPPNHPIFLSFTSGTSGISKGIVHSAWVLLFSMTGIAFYSNLKCGDLLFCNFSMGWIVLNCQVPALALGVTLFLHDGACLFVRNGRNVWDIISDSETSFFIQIPVQLEAQEKMKIVPKPEASLQHIKIVSLAGCPLKHQDYDKILKFFPKDVFVGNAYGSTECFGNVSGIYLKSPAYKGEIQLPHLGIDVRCYNNEGKPVIGELGTAVIATPCPSLPTILWKDIDRTVINSQYLSQFPGTWCMNDACLVNPITNGIQVKGRSDDIFIQYGDRFGADDIYFAIHNIEEIEDYICVSQTRMDGDQRVVLFVKMRKGHGFTPDFKKKIEATIEKELYQDCVPRLILETKEIPYTVNNKRMESIVRKILATNKIPDNISEMNIRNPDCLKYYCDIPEICSYYK